MTCSKNSALTERVSHGDRATAQRPARVSHSASTSATRALPWSRRREQHHDVVVGSSARFAASALLRASKSPLARVNAPLLGHEGIHREASYPNVRHRPDMIGVNELEEPARLVG